jgi:hypothetical protein
MHPTVGDNSGAAEAVPRIGGGMKGRRAGAKGLLTPEQRHLLKKRIDAAVRDRLNQPAAGSARTARPGGHERASTKSTEVSNSR